MPEEEHVDFKILDVGCSARPKGDVNIGFLRGGLNPQTGERIQGEFMSPQKAQKTKNFLLADAAHLPFKDESFNVTFSGHAIEHI
jgi:hypothetical protein